jgi:hypothetical protein
MKKSTGHHTRTTSIKAVFSPDNPRVLRGGKKDGTATWTCVVTQRDSGKKLTPSRVAVIDFPPAADRLLHYGMPADNEICETGIAGWRFTFRGDQAHAGDPPATHALKLKVWVDGIGWNYSDDAWSFEEQV